MVRHAFALAIFASFASPALADLPPPPPARGFKRVPYEIVLKVDKEIPGYKFYPFTRLGLGGQEKIGEELKLGTKSGIVVPSSSSPSVRTGVVAVPDNVMEELKTKENLAGLLSRDNEDKLPAGVVVYETSGTIRDLKSSDTRSKVENVVTISADEAAGVKFTARETPEPPRKQSRTAPANRPHFATLIAGIAAALAMSTLGVWYFRRK
jgi:hypothetical protein